MKNNFRIVFALTISIGLLNIADHANATVRPEVAENTMFFVAVHLDDVPLTFGGMIQNNQGFIHQGKKVLVYEAFGQTNYTADLGAKIFTNERINYV